MDKVDDIDRKQRLVITQSRRIPYDYLVIATGARHAYFGRDDWEELAPGLKTVGDATEIRARILTAFEKAEMTKDATLRARLLTFVIVGGGPTGVELAGAIADWRAKRSSETPPHRLLDRACRVGRRWPAPAAGISGKPVGVGKKAVGKARRRGAARPRRDAMRRERRRAGRRPCDRVGLRVVGGRRTSFARSQVAEG